MLIINFSLLNNSLKVIKYYFSLLYFIILSLFLTFYLQPLIFIFLYGLFTSSVSA